MRVLVTGGAGFIGSMVVEELLERGHEPVVLDLLFWGDDALEPFTDRVAIQKGDCRSSKDVIDALEGVDAVIHLAGLVGEAACRRNAKAHFSINIESTRTLINCCTDPALDLTRDFLFASSCSVYGNVRGQYDRVVEGTPASPLSDYANAKARSETIILERSREVSHFHPTILRLTTLFGWSRRPRLDLVANLFTYQAWKEGRITVFGSGEQFRSLIHVSDVAKAFVDVLEAPRFARQDRILHVGDEAHNLTVREIAELIADLVGGVEVQFLHGKPSDGRDYAIDCTAIRNVIGWQPGVSVREGIEDLLRELQHASIDLEAERLRNSSLDLG